MPINIDETCLDRVDGRNEHGVLPHALAVDEVLDEEVSLVQHFIVMPVERRPRFPDDQSSASRLDVLLHGFPLFIELEQPLLPLAVGQSDQGGQDVRPRQCEVLGFPGFSLDQAVDVELNDICEKIDVNIIFFKTINSKNLYFRQNFSCTFEI